MAKPLQYKYVVIIKSSFNDVFEFSLVGVKYINNKLKLCPCFIKKRGDLL